MRTFPLIALALTLLMTACPAPVAPPVDAGVIACSPLDAGCSDAQSCCDGIACHAGQCACQAMEGAACGGGNASCCPGMACDPSGHCHATCAGPAGACAGPRDVCTTTADCCAPSTCVGGRCEARGTKCADDGEACTTATDCCGSTTLGTRPACVSVNGKSVCRFGRRDETCSPTQPCQAAFKCIVDAGVTPVVDAGTPSDAGADLDAGTEVDAGTPVVDAGTPTNVGTCGVVGNPALCTLRTATCDLGAPCDPNSSANQGYDPCNTLYSGGSLYYRSPSYVCHSGVCAVPQLNDACNGKCSETPGATTKTVCAELEFQRPFCAVTCTSDADCPGVFYPNSSLAGAQRFGSLSHAPLTQWCVPHPEMGKSICQPRLCYEDTPERDNPGFLFKPCPDAPNSVCLPHETGTLSDYFGIGEASTVLGFCQAVRPGAAPTVGQACDERSGTEAPDRLCGADAYCVGGTCRPICDASVPGDFFPACGPSQVCLNPYYGTDPLAGHQTGFCGNACDPFADEAHSGCTNFCGGPRARCQWQGLDKVPGLAHCVAMTAHPKPAGVPCATTGECGTGMLCWSTAADRSNPVCTQLCSQAALPGTPDACRQGTCEPLYDGADKVGACL